MKEIKIGFISLGCDKNRVDTEYMMSFLSKDGYKITNDKRLADVIIINTCGFIESAKKEAIDAILETAELKGGGLKKIIVTGCLAQKYGKLLLKEIPEIDAVTGIGAYDKIKEIINQTFENRRVLNTDIGAYDFTSRIISTPLHYAYLRVSDGCDNRCTYCAIPSIKGAYRSRTFGSIDEELRLLKDGYDIKELILVAQDVTNYGIDLYGEYSLLKLLDLIEKHGFEWVRLLYCYPELVTDGLIRAVSERPELCKYIDIPLQHVNDGVLKSMNRRNDGEYAKRLINRIREIDGDIAIRSTFITGFPTETREAFDELYDFIGEYKLENAGFFSFSKEDGTPAALMKDLRRDTKERRLDALNALQTEVVRQNNLKRIGKIDKVLYDGLDTEKGVFYGRNEFNAPDIDSLVYLEGSVPLEIGRFYSVKITGTEGALDLKGTVVQQY
jgi:ribosomal protein S12 methylthiotransferase